MADIFINYAREDREIARALAQALADQGWSVWWDRHIPSGRRFQRRHTARAHRGAVRDRTVVGRRLGLPWVREEAQDGLDRNILVPARIETVPADRLPDGSNGRFERLERQSGASNFCRLRAGAFWVPALAEAISNADAVIVLLGARGPGSWRRLEYFEALDRKAKDPNFPIVPVLLPNAAARLPSSIPDRLARHHLHPSV